MVAEHASHHAAQPDLESQVFGERLVGVDAHGAQALVQVATFVADGARAGRQQRGYVLVEADLGDQHAAARRIGSERERGRDGRLAGAPLAGDDDEPAIEEGGIRGTRFQGCGPRCGTRRACG